MKKNFKIRKKKIRLQAFNVQMRLRMVCIREKQKQNKMRLIGAKKKTQKREKKYSFCTLIITKPTTCQCHHITRLSLIIKID